MLAAIHTIVQGDLVKGVVPFEDDMDGGHHCAKFSISLSVLHHLYWKFC
jgi:hypothetical protein